MGKLENISSTKSENEEKKETLSKETFYDSLIIQIEDYLDRECNDLISITGNIASLIYHELHEVYGTSSTNWCGFYFVKPKNNNNKNNDKYLVLGPFQGKPACNPIEFDKGVCGFTATNKKSTLVKDVHKFPGHIACDSASNSEIVIPIIYNKTKQLVAILDIDCPKLNGFNEYDQKRLEQICKLIGEKGRWDML